MLAACGGGADEGSTPAGDDAASSDTEATTADAGEAEAPAADNTDTVDGTSFASFTGDAANGKNVFAQCQSCHVVEAGQNRTGPSLAGIVGRAAGTVEGYNYTPANANSGITWSKEKMFQYLENPQRVIPGTKMAFAGLPEAQDRADIIAYLENPGE
jgi:cytochrome c